MNSIYQEFCQSAKKHAHRQALSWRVGRRWHSKNYTDLINEIDSLSAGLAEVLGQDDKVVIISENRPEWLVLDLAVNKLGAITVPIHATSNQSLIEYIVRDAEPKILAVSQVQYEKNSDYIADLMEKNRELQVLVFADWAPLHHERIRTYQSMLKNKNMSEIIVSSVASIIYTSGTTGEPKGVILTNDNILTNARSAIELYEINQADSFLSFLPLSHVLERTLGSVVPILSGAHIAYNHNIKDLQQDMAEIRPTVLISVPKIYERMKDKIFSEIKKGSSLKSKIFYWSLKDHDAKYRQVLADRLVLKKIRNIFGGRLRFAVSGGAAIHPRIIKFFHHAGLKIIEGYGLTETSPIIAANRLDECHFGTVGMAFPGVEIKIAGDKEILVKGNNVTPGYYNKLSATVESFDDAGYFKTGDLGHLSDKGILTIIGRKKDIIVISTGKNVYPEKIESILNLSSYISQSLVVGHKKNYVAALIVPDKEALARDFSGDEAVWKKAIDLEIQKVNKELMQHEKLRKHYVLNRQFSLERDELTPTLKIRRHMIERNEASLIEKLFNES